MSAVRAHERCGVCDSHRVMAICEHCREATCAAHLRRIGGDEWREYVCVECALLAEERLEEELRAAGVP